MQVNKTYSFRYNSVAMVGSNTLILTACSYSIIQFIIMSINLLLNRGNLKSIIFLVGLTLYSFPLFAQHSDSLPTGADKKIIPANQIGFYPNGPKIAVIPFNNKGQFQIINAGHKVIFTGKLTRSSGPDLGGDMVWIADFSPVKTPGSYQLEIPATDYRQAFRISRSVYKPVADASIKAYYFMRASTALPEKYAGKWHRAEGHPDTAVLVHSSAATDKRPAGTKISSPRGWYDAGDYNKYVVNSGISTSTLLRLYEEFPVYMKTVKLNLPETGNGIPDVLNETLWNIRWMLTMQDPNDGGVYHKLTNAAFDGMEMPDKGTAPRYVVQKGTAATLDFAAVMAQASRIFSGYPKQLPGLADSCINAAEKAWAWALKYPNVLYQQDEMNKKFSPPVTTGAYGDSRVKDEFIWAAAELLVTTHNKKYADTVNLLPDQKMLLPTWSQVHVLAYYTLIKNEKAISNLIPAMMPVLKKKLLAFNDDLVSGADETAYKTVMQKSARNFGWGSNSVAANQGIALIQAYQLSGNKKYLLAALGNLDYLLGRNPTGYCYITGFGIKSPMHPHHRPSVADGVIDPVPGLLVGGPNPGMQDGIQVPSKVPDRAYIDDDRAYAANEIAINWNAPFAYLSNAIEALQSQLAEGAPPK